MQVLLKEVNDYLIKEGFHIFKDTTYVKIKDNNAYYVHLEDIALKLRVFNSDKDKAMVSYISYSVLSCASIGVEHIINKVFTDIQCQIDSE